MTVVNDATERATGATISWPVIRDLIMLAVKFEGRLALEDPADDRDVFASAQERLAERHAVPAFDDLRAGRPDPAQKAIARHRLQGHRGHRRAGRGARRHLHDTGAGFDSLGLRQD